MDAVSEISWRKRQTSVFALELSYDVKHASTN